MTTPRDNMLRCLRRQGYDWVPIDMDLCDSQREAFKKRFGADDYPAHFRFCHRSVWSNFAPSTTDWRTLYKREALPDETWFDSWGVGHSKGSEAAFHMTRMHHPLKGDVSADEIRHYPFPVCDPSDVARVTECVAQVHGQGLAAMGGMACTIWETAWYMRSMEDLMMDMMMGDEKARLLLDKITDVSCERAAGYARAGVDILHGGDDIGTQAGPMLSVEMWEEWLKPRWKKVIDAARAIKPDILVFYHSCGNATAFISGLIDIGVNILNPVQPECMDFNEIHRQYGDRLSFWGTIGTQSTMPFGTAQDVRDVVTSRLKTCGKKGGIVIGPTHLVEPEVPWENLMALYETARDFKP
jgi:uroporphyrinogen decarboxylase